MGRVYKRGNIWWIQYYVHGRLFRESSRSPLKSVSVAILKKREGEGVDGRLPSTKAQKTTFDDLARLYIQDYEINQRKSIDNAHHYIAHLSEHFVDVRAMEITTQRINDYIVHRQSQRAANATINRELSAIKRMFRLGTLQTPPFVLSIPHIPRLKEDNVRKGFFAEEEYRALRSALPDHLKIPFIIGYWTGMRAGEILGLRWEQVEPERRLLRLEPGTTKNKHGRTVPLVREVMEILDWWKDYTLSRYPYCPWICHYQGRRLHEIPHQAWKKVCERVGLKGKLFHDLRRTAIRNMVRAGIPERVAMEISGHKTRSIFDRYDIVDEADLCDAVAKLQEFSFKSQVHI